MHPGNSVGTTQKKWNYTKINVWKAPEGSTLEGKATNLLN